MKTIITILFFAVAFSACGQVQEKVKAKAEAKDKVEIKEDEKMNEYRKLTDFEEYVIIQKGTERRQINLNRTAAGPVSMMKLKGQ